MQEAIRPDINPWKAAFWDLPELSGEGPLREALASGDARFRAFVMERMLERGRAVDALRIFGLMEIGRELDGLRLSPAARARWNRFLEVYGTPRA